MDSREIGQQPKLFTQTVGIWMTFEVWIPRQINYSLIHSICDYVYSINNGSNSILFYQQYSNSSYIQLIVKIFFKIWLNSWWFRSLFDFWTSRTNFESPRILPHFEKKSFDNQLNIRTIWILIKLNTIRT